MSGNGFRLGIGPIGWANDDIREWGAGTSAEQIMRDMLEAGFEGSEMSYTYPQEPAALKEALGRHGLVLSAAYHWTNLSRPERIPDEMVKARRHVDFCAAAGAKHALVAEGGGSLHWDADGPRDAVEAYDEATWNRLCAALNELGEYALGKGVQLAVHPHAGTAVESAEAVGRLLQGTDRVRVGYCLDTAHALYGGLDPLQAVRAWGDRIRYVHVKDVRRDVLEKVRAERAPFVEAIKRDVFGEPGTGCIDFAAVVAALREHGYSGWLVVEGDQDPSRHPPREVARRANEYLREIIAR